MREILYFGSGRSYSVVNPHSGAPVGLGSKGEGVFKRCCEGVQELIGILSCFTDCVQSRIFRSMRGQNKRAPQILIGGPSGDGQC